MVITKIGKELKEDTKDLIIDFCIKEDYLGCVFSPPQFQQIFHISDSKFYGFLKRFDLTLPKSRRQKYFVSKKRDVSWVKYDISLEHYLKTLSRYLSFEEIAVQLDTTPRQIRVLLEKTGLCRRSKGWFPHKCPKRKEGKWVDGSSGL